MYYILLYIDFIILGCSFLISMLLFIKKGVPLYLHFFTLLIGVTLIVKIVGHQMAVNMGNNHIVYNFFSVFTLVFYFLVLNAIIQRERFKRIIYFSALIYPVLAVLNIFFVQGVNTFHTYSYGVGAILVVVFCAFYLEELFFVEEPIPGITRLPDFWICLGLLFFYPVTFLGLTSTLITLNYPPAFLRIMSLVLMIPEYILYLCFTIAFLCCLKKPISPDPPALEV